VGVSLKAILLFVVLPLFLRTFAGNYNAALFPDDYDSIAWNLVSGEGYRLSADTAPTLLRSPGYVLVLAALFACFGKSLLAAQVLNLAFSLGTAYVVFLLALNLCLGDRRVAWVAASFALFYPATFIAESRGGLESFFTLCLAVTFLLAYRAERVATYRSQIITGLSFGLAMLVKASVALIMPAFWVYRLVSRRSLAERKTWVLRYAAAGVAAALIQVPWIVRNYEVSGEFVPTMTAGSMALDQGRYVISNYTFSRPHADLVHEADDRELAIAEELGLEFKPAFFPRFYRTSDELAFYRHLREGALNDYRQSPELPAQAPFINSIAFCFQGL